MLSPVSSVLTRRLIEISLPNRLAVVANRPDALMEGRLIERTDDFPLIEITTDENGGGLTTRVPHAKIVDGVVSSPRASVRTDGKQATFGCEGVCVTTMIKAKFQTVDEYISQQPERVAAKLAIVRSIIRKALPNAEEVISYNMPAYRHLGEIVLYLAGWKQHYSLYPA